MRPIDLAGQRFGKLIAMALTKKYNRRAYLCQCDCGKRVISLSDQLLRGKVISCGCFKRMAALTHGKTNSREYIIWNGMIKRCINKNSKDYKYYGERGISVDESWLKFAKFYADMGDSNGLTIERLDNNGNYCKENCVWADMKTQRKNRRTPERRLA